MNSKKDRLSADDVQKIFNKLVSVLRKNSHLLLFLMTGKSLSSSYLMIKRRRNTELSLREFLKHFRVLHKTRKNVNWLNIQMEDFIRIKIKLKII